MYYRFKCGVFIEADSFNEAVSKFIDQLNREQEEQRRWHKCTCLGLSHKHNCPENPINKGEIPY